MANTTYNTLPKNLLPFSNLKKIYIYSASYPYYTISHLHNFLKIYIFKIACS
uniref:Uncharacterized protein n=1 Tax=Helianthus annuus TaxID=4232 RepID=A0A251U8B9_HELAN